MLLSAYGEWQVSERLAPHPKSKSSIPERIVDRNNDMIVSYRRAELVKQTYFPSFSSTHPFRPPFSMMVFTLLSGCGGGKISLENDALRSRVLELELENELLHTREIELKTELNRNSQRNEALSSEIRESIPHVTNISIGHRFQALEF